MSQIVDRRADVRDSYAFHAIRLAFGEAAARQFLLVNYHFKHGQGGVTDIERNRLDFVERDRLDLEF